MLAEAEHPHRDLVGISGYAAPPFGEEGGEGQGQILIPMEVDAQDRGGIAPEFARSGQRADAVHEEAERDLVLVEHPAGVERGVQVEGLELRIEGDQGLVEALHPPAAAAAGHAIVMAVELVLEIGEAVDPAQLGHGVAVPAAEHLGEQRRGQEAEILLAHLREPEVEAPQVPAQHRAGAAQHQRPEAG